jgi:ribosomal protein S12 methylthiotransferase accessory factor YcaO
MINEFNGPSAGNCVEEALSQGICELVERHVSSLISTNNLDGLVKSIFMPHPAIYYETNLTETPRICKQ